MPGKHATLSPSSAERWINCPASVTLAAGFPNESSVYAEEGTLAHELGEIKVSLEFGIIDKPTFRKRERQFHGKLADWLTKLRRADDFEETLAEMERHTDAYVELIKERAAIYPMTQVMVEQRMDTGVPGCWGTSDTVLVSPVHVEIVDFKYGAGVAVEAEGNPQLRLYALGALDTYGDLLGETENVYTTVHQPRMDHVLTAELTADALREWRSRILPIAEEALAGSDRFGPSDEACRWCPASGQCRAQVEAAFPDDLLDNKPDLLEPAEMAELLGKLPLLKDWLKAFEEAALNLAYTKGTPIPGWKVVRSGGQRRISNESGALDFLREQGYTDSQLVSTKIKGIGELEKLLGKAEFATLLEPYITKSEGRESLAPESDKREAIAPTKEANKVFDDIEEN